MKMIRYENKDLILQPAVRIPVPVPLFKSRHQPSDLT